MVSLIMIVNGGAVRIVEVLVLLLFVLPRQRMAAHMRCNSDDYQLHAASLVAYDKRFAVKLVLGTLRLYMEYRPEVYTVGNNNDG